MKIKKKTETIGIRIEPSVKKSMLDYASENDISLTELIILSFDLFKSSNKK